MLLAIYENKKYKTIHVPLEKKKEIQEFLRKEGIRWYTMGWSEGEKEDVNKTITAEVR
jgi:hypothetical protein